MSIQAAIVTLAKANGPIAGFIGTRIANATIPDKLARPNVTHQLVGNVETYANDGPVNLNRATIQLNCYADKPVQATALAKAVKDLFSGYKGTVGNLTIQSMFKDDERDAPEPPSTGQTLGIAGVILTYSVNFSE